jgi:hypothetical protein
MYDGGLKGSWSFLLPVIKCIDYRILWHVVGVTLQDGSHCVTGFHQDPLDETRCLNLKGLTHREW